MVGDIYAAPIQVAIAIESTEGVQPSMTAADVVSKVGPAATPDVVLEMVDVDVVSDFDTPTVSVRGKSSASAAIRVPLVGGGDGTTLPPADRYLRMAGAQQFVANSIDLIGAPTGTYTPGEKITDGTTKIGAFVKMLDTATMLYVTISGAAFAAADTLTGALSGATSDVHGTPNLTAMGFGYRPRTSGRESAAIEIIEGRDRVTATGLKTTILGARGDGRVVIEGAGMIGYLEVDPQGRLKVPPEPEDSAYYAATYPTTLPESFVNAGVTVHTDALSLSRLTLNMANAAELLEDANAPGGVAAGRIGGRAPTIEIDPTRALEANVDFWAKLDAAGTFGFFAQCGSTAGVRWCLVAPQAQYQSLGKGTRGGNTGTYEASLKLTGVGDDEWMIVFF